MSFDLETRRSVARCVLGAALFAIAGCRPAIVPEPPGDEPTPPRVVKRAAPPPGRQALLGEMCPQGAGGRPGLSPLAVRAISWSSDRADLTPPLARGTAAQFAVLAVDGRRAGLFSAIGTADVDGTEVAVGSYAGAPPCSRLTGTEAAVDPVCVKAQRGCGLAVATLGEPGGAFGTAEAPVIAVGGACQTGDALAIDIDGDGAPEVFPLAAFVDPVRAPAEEVTAAAQVAATCTPGFARHGMIPAIAPGPTLDARHKVELDLLGVLDVDRDGRHEVVMAFRYAERRTIAVYSAIESPVRLELVGETVPWP